ncbi:MAG: DNA recombination protein RmuC [Acidimicrobiia bacterium]|nr:DNA recombination protein RmuC [Acidimicrobiia bacterium]
MEIVIAVVAALVVGGVIGIIVVRAVKPEVSGGADVNSAVQAAVEGQRLQANAERDQAVQAAVQMAVVQLQQMNEAARQSESESVKGELDLRAQRVSLDYQAVTEQLKDVTKMVQKFEQEGSERFGSVASALEQTNHLSETLNTTASELKRVLSSGQARGQWGERMAEDILQLHGFVEGIQYRKQLTIEPGRPDYTFNLPGETKLYMDVKFPLDNYSLFVSAETDPERDAARKQFLTDVKNHVKGLASRSYSESSSDTTIDFVLLFVPNEAVYKFIHEEDSSIINDALNKKLVICSPITLYAVLGVINQATKSFEIEKSAQELMVLLGKFEMEWKKFVEQMTKVGKNLDTAKTSFGDLEGVRQRKLDDAMTKVQDLKRGALSAAGETPASLSSDTELEA